MNWKSIMIFIYLFLLNLTVSPGLKLPGDDCYPGWKVRGSTDRYLQQDLYGHINGGAELFLEFGFDSLLVRGYHHDGQEITLQVYCLERPESALGIYLMKCGKETPLPEITARNTGSRQQIMAVKNRYVIQCNQFKGDKESQAAMIALVNGLLKSIPDVEDMDLWQILPREDIIPGSQRLIRGPYALQPIYTFGEDDILQLQGQTFAFCADYRDASGEQFTRLIIPYSNPQKARAVFDGLRNHLDPYLKIVRASATELVFRDYQDKYGIIRMEESRLHIRVHLSALP